MNSALRTTTLVVLVSVVVSITACTYLRAQSSELIVDILTTPNKYWNKSVLLRGHVRSVAANPPGTNRGSYVLRDSSDCDITILTDDLPAPGKLLRITGTVEQVSQDQRVPMVRESRRLLVSAVGGAPVAESQPAPRPERSRAAPAADSQAPPKAVEKPAAPVVAAPPAVVVQVPAPEQPVWHTPAIIGLAALAVVLLALLAFIVRQKMSSAPPAGPAVAASAAGAAPKRASVPDSSATQALGHSKPPEIPVSKATEVFVDLGAELQAIEGPDRGKLFQLTKPSVTLGRSGARQNDITLSDSTVSRTHAKIIYSFGEKAFMLINESTTNPVRLNNEPKETARLADNDVIQLGATVLRFKKTRPA